MFNLGKRDNSVLLNYEGYLEVYLRSFTINDDNGIVTVKPERIGLHKCNDEDRKNFNRNDGIAGNF